MKPQGLVDKEVEWAIKECQKASKDHKKSKNEDHPEEGDGRKWKTYRRQNGRHPVWSKQRL